MPGRSTTLPTAVKPTLAVRIVLGVARLGEADLEGWWSSQGMNPAVRFTLAGFRRTAKVVGAELALLSATRRHRQIIPRDSAVHLFSPYLPFAGWARAYLAEQKTSGESPIIDELLGWSTADVARSQLQEWGAEVTLAAHDGASVRPAELHEPAVLGGLLVRFTQSYVVQRGELSVPYVDLVV